MDFCNNQQWHINIKCPPYEAVFQRRFSNRFDYYYYYFHFCRSQCESHHTEIIPSNRLTSLSFVILVIGIDASQFQRIQ